MDAVALAPLAGEQKLLRLYLVPKGTNPSLMASTAPSAAPSAGNNNNNNSVLDVDLTPLLNSLANNNGGNPIASLLSLLSSQMGKPTTTSSDAPAPEQQQCPYLAGGIRYICDGCNNSPISGNVNQCDTCPDFHLCDPCRDTGVHLDKNHSFTVNPTRPNRAHRWNRRPHHHGWNNGQNPVPAPVPAPVPVAPAVPAVPSSPNVDSPAIKPVPSPVKNIPFIPSPILPTQPAKPQIVETTNKNPIVPAPQLVPSEKLEMAFLSDVTIPDGSEIIAGENFSKVWRLSNSGTTTWPLGCRLTLESNTGECLSTVKFVDIPGEVPSGSAVTISVEMEAPKKTGRHVSYWRMHGPSGAAFGARIWVDIISVEKPAPQVAAPAAAAAVVPAAPADPAAAGIKPGEKYAAQLESLYRMGFLNLDLNRNLLEHNKGNVAAVIDQLFSFSQH